MSSLKVIIPFPAEALTFNPPNSSVAPIAPEKRTVPVPDVIVNVSSLPPSDSIAAPKVTPPVPVPVLIVIVCAPPALPLIKSTPAVPNSTLSFVVVKVEASVISIF